jgi:hypothetical protein
LTVAGVGWYGDDIINKNKPTSLYMEEYAADPEKVRINRE